MGRMGSLFFQATQSTQSTQSTHFTLNASNDLNDPTSKIVFRRDYTTLALIDDEGLYSPYCPLSSY